MIWFKTVDHRGQEVDIASVDDMNAVIVAYEARLDQLLVLLEGSDRDGRRRAATEYRAMTARHDRIAADVLKVKAHAKLESEDRYHRELAEAIRGRTQS